MTISGYPLWVVLLIGVGVFFASFVDAIGGGGGIISVPVYLLAGLPTHNALATNKMSACLGTMASTLRYLASGFVDWGLALPAVAFALVGSHFGTRLQIMADERYLKYMLLIVLPVVAAVMLKQKKFPEEKGVIDRKLQCVIVWASALVIGLYDGFYGPGTGTFLLLI
ncbi:MAG: TSUP family transporter, partial [Oscillospiraceae bacterium]|nr:TSUP family transporter [Oscillospiraceae bacterium]